MKMFSYKDFVVTSTTQTPFDHLITIDCWHPYPKPLQPSIAPQTQQSPSPPNLTLIAPSSLPNHPLPSLPMI